MSTETDWQNIRENVYSPDAPPDWPDNVRAITIDGTSLIGVHTETGELYWDGKKVVTQKPITLGLMERIIAIFAAMGTFGVFVLEFLKSMGYLI